MSTNALPMRLDTAGRPTMDHWSKSTLFQNPYNWELMLQGVDTRGKRADAFGNEFIVPELIHISKIVNEQVFPENTFAQAFVLAPDQPAWYDVAYMYADLEFAGTPTEDTGSWIDPGIPVGISRKPNLSPIAPVPVNYSVNVAELARFAEVGMSAMAAKAVQARRIVEQTFDVRAWLGNSNLNIPGFALAQGISRDTFTTGSWATATGSQIYEDLRQQYQAIVSASKGVWIPDTIALPMKLKSILTKPMVIGTTALLTSVEQYIAQNLDCQLLYTVRLNDINKDNASGTGAVAMYKKDNRVMRHVMPRGYYELGPQQVGRTLTVYADGVSGGLVIPQPTACALWDGAA